MKSVKKAIIKVLKEMIESKKFDTQKVEGNYKNGIIVNVNSADVKYTNVVYYNGGEVDYISWSNELKENGIIKEDAELEEYLESLYFEIENMSR